MRLLLLLVLAAPQSNAGTWTGILVDSRCYQSLVNNRNPTDTLFNVNQDRNSKVSYCSPKAKTKSFGVLQLDGSVSKLDPAGNANAEVLVRSAPKGAKKLSVTVTGEISHNTVKVDSIVRTP